MGRAYKMKGQKRKKKEEKYDRAEEEISNPIEEPIKKAKTEEEVQKEEEEEEKQEEPVTNDDDMPGIPIALIQNSGNKNGVIFILEKASLEIAKVGKSFQLLSSDEHASYLVKNRRNPADYRPDIAHQTIQMILDSRVNKSGRMKALYVKTQQGLLIEIKPHARMPRTYKRFAGLMVQLLQKLHITAAGKGEKLLRVIKNPVSQYLPVNSRKIGFSHSSEKLVDMYDYVDTLNNDSDLVFVVGAMAHGKIEKESVDDFISISEYPLSAVYCIGLITTSLERKWRIL